MASLDASYVGNREYRPRYKDTCKFISSLKQCSKTSDLEGGRKLHLDAVAASVHTDRYVAAGLINMYMKCGSVHSAREVFDGTPFKNVVMWNCLLLGYVENGESSTAMDLFTTMDCKPTHVTYVAALKACAKLAMEKHSEKQVCLEKGITIHKQIKASGCHSNITVASTLVDMYSKCGSMELAREVFDRMVHKDIISWNSLLLGYVENGESSVAMELFNMMECEPTEVTYIAALKACAGLAIGKDSDKQFCLEKGIAIHRELKELGDHMEIVLINTLIDMYGKCGSMQHARGVFDSMMHRNVVTWNCLLMGYVENNESSIAMELFTKMECEPTHATYIVALKACATLAVRRELAKELCLVKGIGVHQRIKDHGYESNVVLASALVDMYSKCGSMKRARWVFDRMIYKDIIVWNSLLLGYVENGEGLVSLDLLHKMDCEGTYITFLIALKTCAELAKEDKQFSLRKGAAIHEQARKRGYDSELVVGNSLVDMYGKCGSMERAKEVFDKMVLKDVVTWNSLIMGYVGSGENSTAINLFTKMDCEPDNLTYVAALKACGSMALLQAGEWIHASVCRLGMEEVTSTLVDFYGKCGCIVKVEVLFSGMHSPDTVSWNALIAGYVSLGGFSQVFNVGKSMHEAGLQMDGVTFACFLTACSHAGLVEEGEKYFRFMSKCGVSPCVEHYNCMVDMLCRVKRFEDAMCFIKSMPMEPNSVTWATLLGACRKWRNMEAGKVAFDALATRGLRDTTAYILMDDMYKSLRLWGDQERSR